ncbi:hypothetical protein PTI98_007340 [Pleurotus ostreatus]|nr:hypothetical protein PTI98_007340 [Pleurotus ostreatus]
MHGHLPALNQHAYIRTHLLILWNSEKYVTRTEYDDLKSRFEHLEALVHSMASQGPVSHPPSIHSAPLLPPPGAVPHYLPPQPPPGPGPGESSSPNPSTYAVAPSGFTSHALYSQLQSPPPHAYHQHLGPQVQPHAPPYDQGRPQSNSSPVQAQRYDIHPQQHQPFPPIHSSPQIRSPGLSGPSLMGPPLPHKEQRSPPFQPAMLTKKSPLSLAAITSPTSPRQKNFHAQTLKLGERLRPLEVSVRATEDPAAVVMRAVIVGDIPARRNPCQTIIRLPLHRRPCLEQTIRHPGDPGISLLRATDSWRNLNVRAHDGTNSIRGVPTVGIPHDPLAILAFALVVAFLVTLPIYDPNPNHPRHSFVDHLPHSAGYQRVGLLINVSPTFLHIFGSSRQNLLSSKWGSQCPSSIFHFLLSTHITKSCINFLVHLPRVIILSLRMAIPPIHKSTRVHSTIIPNVHALPPSFESISKLASSLYIR